MFSQNYVWTGLGTLSFTVPNAGIYKVHGDITLPRLVSGDSANSECVVTIDVASSEEYVGAAGATGFTLEFSAAAGDAVDIEFASAAAVDEAKNAIKANIQVSQGL